MKKSLIGWVVFAAFSSVASAQSSVTIYGLVDAGITKQNDGTSVLSGGNGATGSAGSRWDVRQGTTSRLGFKGVEDLGGGVRAAFNIEHRFATDTGNTSTINGVSQPFWGGRTTVSLQSAFGEVLLGRDYIPAYWVALEADPFAWNTVGQLGGNFTFAGYSAADGVSSASAFVASRNGNSVIYKSPVLAGGVTASGSVSLGEGSRGTLGRSVGANVEYRAGAIYGGFGFDQTQNNAAGSDPRLMIATGSYDFRFVKPVVSYARSRNVAGLSTKSLSLGLDAPLGAVGVLHGVVARLDPSGTNDKATKVALGYEHRLSKRTSLYSDVASTKTDSFTRTTGFDIGVTHRF